MIQSLLNRARRPRQLLPAPPDPERNIALLKAIRLPDGRSAFDVAHAILNRHPTSSATDAATAQRLGLPGFDPSIESETPAYFHDIKKDVSEKIPGRESRLGPC